MELEAVFYQSKPKASKIGTSMEEEEEEVEKQSPQTPAKQIPNRTDKTYSRKPGKQNTSSSSDVSTITDSSEKSDEAKQPLLPDLNIPCCQQLSSNFSRETNSNLESEITETIADDASVGDLGVATEKEGDNWKFVLVYADRLSPSFNPLSNSTESPESVSPCGNCNFIFCDY